MFRCLFSRLWPALCPRLVAHAFSRGKRSSRGADKCGGGALRLTPDCLQSAGGDRARPRKRRRKYSDTADMSGTIGGIRSPTRSVEGTSRRGGSGAFSEAKCFFVCGFPKSLLLQSPKGNVETHSAQASAEPPTQETLRLNAPRKQAWRNASSKPDFLVRPNHKSLEAHLGDTFLACKRFPQGSVS